MPHGETVKKMAAFPPKPGADDEMMAVEMCGCVIYHHRDEEDKGAEGYWIKYCPLHRATPGRPA